MVNAIRAFQSLIENERVQIQTDSQTARTIFYKGSTKSHLQRLVLDLWAAADEFHVDLEYDCLMTPEELKRLADHKYSAVDTSWLDELCMKYFWEWAVEFYPLWLAPNLITLIGLIVNLITVLVLSHYCPTAREVAPSWAYALAALGLFTYQTLDATGDQIGRIWICEKQMWEN
ncbi:hypothetical protein ANCCEY_01675 [Ancylostoma ceylanicum]|uniref:Uncharacterized protein n=1 Tax=Ancylostoma ceylanicum TaxID=53326 RepID=A0A0D6MCP1_9BILA|nr:hypothetical protein ANCCEY_01675 [Ancylostoma ceylanicum]